MPDLEVSIVSRDRGKASKRHMDVMSCFNLDEIEKFYAVTWNSNYFFDVALPAYKKILKHLQGRYNSRDELEDKISEAENLSGFICGEERDKLRIEKNKIVHFIEYEAPMNGPCGNYYESIPLLRIAYRKNPRLKKEYTSVILSPPKKKKRRTPTEREIDKILGKYKNCVDVMRFGGIVDLCATAGLAEHNGHQEVIETCLDSLKKYLFLFKNFPDFKNEELKRGYVLGDPTYHVNEHYQRLVGDKEK